MWEQVTETQHSDLWSVSIKACTVCGGNKLLKNTKCSHMLVLYNILVTTFGPECLLLERYDSKSKFSHFKFILFQQMAILWRSSMFVELITYTYHNTQIFRKLLGRKSRVHTQNEQIAYCFFLVLLAASVHCTCKD